ncbi:MAG: hypothetical protein ACK5KN_16735 [Dysgonomonas sp.]|uniref:hypothetical protein n=1 Tax=Dysgonomonas sp. TaxID=1891233 RepID=UPI003A86C716
MKTTIEYLRSQKVKDQYGDFVYIIEVRGNTAFTDNGMYHTTKLFVKGQAISNLFK